MSDADRPRARQAGVPFEGTPGTWNAITDVPGVEVGHSTIVKGSGQLVVGEGPIRTGVTAVLPLGKSDLRHVPAAYFSLNGTGEMTQSHEIEELGRLIGPVMLTNTNSVGVVHSATTRWLRDNDPAFVWALPAVAETWDGLLNDINGFHVTEQHAIDALNAAATGPVGEGCVGAGTGTVAFEYKAGIGTSSRKVGDNLDQYTVGVLVQANCSARTQLMVGGFPVGRYLGVSPSSIPDAGSIIVVVATDAPLYPHELKRVVRRAAMGLARTGSTAAPESGDLFIAFSTTSVARPPLETILPGNEQSRDPLMRDLFKATVFATEEAITNSLFAAATTTGINDRTIEALPIETVMELLRRHDLATVDR